MFNMSKYTRISPASPAVVGQAAEDVHLICVCFSEHTKRYGDCICSQSKEQKTLLNSFFKKTVGCTVINFKKE